jgi:hypothetical protein
MYTKNDFKKCFFNPLDEDLMENDRVQALIPAQTQINDELVDDDRVIRFVFAMYDPKSPLVRDYPDLNTRKLSAATIAGFDIANKEEERLMEQLFSCDSEFLVLLIKNFLKEVVKSRVWAAIQADEQVFWEFVIRLLLPITRGDKDKDLVAAVSVKTKLSEDKENINERIDRNWSRFVGDDQQLVKKMETSDFSPEGYAGV